MRTLEYDKILSMLADRAPTDGAKEMALALTPEKDPDRIIRMQRLTTEAKEIQAIKGMPSFGRVKDIRDTAERAAKGAVLTPRELLDLANVLRTSRSLLEYSRTNRHFETVLDGATFEAPATPPQGIEWVLIGGEVALRDGKIVNDRLGRAVRK